MCSCAAEDLTHCSLVFNGPSVIIKWIILSRSVVERRRAPEIPPRLLRSHLPECAWL